MSIFSILLSKNKSNFKYYGINWGKTLGRLFGIKLRIIGRENFDCNKQYMFEIYEMWRHKYEDGVTHNTEHVFLLELENKVDIKIDSNEHTQYEWITRVKAAEKVFSHTNRQAIFDLI